MGQSCSRRAEVGRQRILCSRFLKARGCRKHHFIDLPGLKGSTRSAHTHALSFPSNKISCSIHDNFPKWNGKNSFLLISNRVVCVLSCVDVCRFTVGKKNNKEKNIG